MSAGARAPALSVVIPTRDKPTRLRLTLACLASQRGAPEWELLVVDDGSGDATQSVLLESAARLPLRVLRDTGRGRAAARNRGAAEARGRLLLFLDDDILVGRGFLAEHAAAQARRPGLVHGSLRELIGASHLSDPAVGGPGVPPLRADELARGGFEGGGRLYANALERAIEMMYDGRLPNVAPWLAGVGANLSLPRPALVDAGGFDESFGRGWGCEDLELGLRLLDRDLPAAVAAEARGVHLSHERPGRWDEHAATFERFARLHPRPAVRALPELLGPSGSPERYVEAVLRHTRSA